MKNIQSRNTYLHMALLIIIITTGSAQNTWASKTCQNIVYKSTVSSDSQGFLDLTAQIRYETTRKNAPIAVLMHAYSGIGYGGYFYDIGFSSDRLVAKGFFCISVAMRQREGSDGVRNSGGTEIYDIWDAIEHVKSTYPDLVDTSNVHITGYSGGGGNVMSALTKFPDYFRAGSPFFGMSDYGYDRINGWYFNGAGAGRTPQLDLDIGDATLNDPAVTDRYMARASNLASVNNHYSEIHLFVNNSEYTCPKINCTSFRDNAVARASYPGEFDNITVHIGREGLYYDFDGDGVDDPDEHQCWPHSYPGEDMQNSAENWYVDRLLSGAIAEPVLDASDTFFVAGFVRTKKFFLWMGDGNNMAGELYYNLTPTEKRFELKVLSSNKALTSKLVVDLSDVIQGQNMAVILNGESVDTFNATGEYSYDSLKHNDVLVLRNISFDVPFIGFEPSQLSFSVSQGGQNPAPAIVKVKNMSIDTLNAVTTPIQVSYASGQPTGWLSVTPTGGGPNLNEQWLMNSVNIATLTPDTYSATISITVANAENSPQTYGVTLVVQDTNVSGIIATEGVGKGSIGTGRIMAPTGFTGNMVIAKIISVDGRLLRQINVPVNGGYLDIKWDGNNTAGMHTGTGAYYISVDFGGKTVAAKGILIK